MASIDPDPHRRRDIEVLRAMSPQDRLAKACELTETTRQLLRVGLRRRYPDASQAEIEARYLDRLTACHNKNY